MRIRKTVLRLVGVSSLLFVGLCLLVGMVVAANGVTLLTQPAHKQVSIYQDFNANGVNDSGELIGVFDVYDGNQPITFNWQAYPFAANVNGSYRVSMVQNITPLGATATWQEVVIGHHWASNPNGTMYTMGPFSPQTTCTNCPTHFVVQPETYALLYDPTTDTYEYEYTPIAAALGGAAASLTQSDDFVLEIVYVAPPDSGDDDSCSSGNCAEACSTFENCVNACESAPGCDVEEACEDPGTCIATCESGGFGKVESSTCGNGGCFDAYVIYCELSYEDEEDVEDCLEDYDFAVSLGFCEVCADDPEECVSEGYTASYSSYK